MMLIPQPLLQALHDYLITKPMSEVEQLVAAIRQCKPAPEPTPESKD